MSSAVSQKDALHSSSTASNLGTHVRAHGVDDLMVVSIINILVIKFIITYESIDNNFTFNSNFQEEVDPNEVSFESRFGAQSSHPNHFGDQLHPGHTLQVSFSAT